ncbi:trypsin-like peptidase domain-containing protein [Plantactinospora sp. WMMB334]|uniref:trypsin-like peptidase domain-containing protein n=1 Tax=Plantactinospora sp. WMMB334 TaxID=3404119 RepID=UPI003B96306C
MSHSGRAEWRACIRDDRAGIRGGGIVLGDRHVLTCAHILLPAAHGERSTVHGPPSDDFQVEFVGRSPGASPGWARVAGGCWKPPQDDQRADLALLELADPLPEGTGPEVLRRLPSNARRRVRMFGFPAAVPTGVWARARLGGDGGPGGEWIQLDRDPVGPAVEAGFSGTAVFDEETDQVVGVVVSYLARGGAGTSWMIPVETIIRYLPRTREWVSGDSAVDESFARPVGPVVSDETVVRQLTEFLAPGARPETRVIVTTPGSAVHAAVRDVVLRTSREFRPADAGPPESAPAAAGGPRPGRIDLALDVSGRTADEVSSRIVNWMSVGASAKSLADCLAGEPPPMSLVLDGVDRAADPEALIAKVVLPIAERMTGHDLRLLLVFHDDHAPSLGYAATELLGKRIAVLQAAEEAAWQRYLHVAERVAPVDPPKRSGAKLRLRLTALRAAASRPGDTPLLPAVEVCRPLVEEALAVAEEARRDLDARLDERDRLRERLDVYRASVPERLREDRELTALYRETHEALWHGPSDLAVCAALVDRYGTLIRRRGAGPDDQPAEMS